MDHNKLAGELAQALSAVGQVGASHRERVGQGGATIERSLLGLMSRLSALADACGRKEDRTPNGTTIQENAAADLLIDLSTLCNVASYNLAQATALRVEAIDAQLR